MKRCMDAARLALICAAWVSLLASASNAQMGGRMGAGPGGGAGPNPAARGPTFRDRVADSGGPQYGPRGTMPLVREVKILGNETVTEHFIYQQLRTRPEREFDPEVVQADVRRLASTGKFRDVDTFRQDVPGGGVVVTFRVFERPTIRYVRFLGNRGIGDNRLRVTSGLSLGDAINRFAVEEGRRKIEEYYRSKGFSKAQVEIREGVGPKDRGVVYVVLEGPVERVAAVRFVGNTIATDSRLKTQIESKPGYLWYFLRGKLEPNKLDSDLERLTAYYRGLGYFNARIGREVDYDRSGKWATVTFVINEGPRYVVRNVSVEGNVKFPAEALQRELELSSGDFFQLTKMQVDVNKLRDIYGAQGHIFADIKADPRFLEEPGQLDVTYRIEEGGMFRVGEIRVHIAGEFPHTRQNVVLNRLSLTPGDIIDIREVRASERRLKFSQLFENNPGRGSSPRIVIRPPQLDQLEAIADERGAAARRGSAIRGQNPRRSKFLPW